MADLSVHVITDNTNLLPHVRREVLNCGGRIVGEHPRARDALPAIRDNPDSLVILDLPDKSRLHDLTSISLRVPQAQVVVLTYDRNVDWILQCHRKGAAQVILAPINSQDFAEAIQRITYQQQHLHGKGIVIAVTGATHRAGATFTACNLANELGELLDQNIFLADFNVNMGAVATYLDIAPQYTLGELFEYGGQLDRQIVETAITRVGPYLNVLAAPRDWLGKDPVDLNRADELITVLQGMERFTVLDVPCTYDDLFFSTLIRSDFAVLLAEQDVPSVRALGQIVGKLYNESISADQIVVVINRYGTDNQKVAVEDIEPVIQHPVNHQIANDYEAARGAIDHGQLLKANAPESPLRRDIVSLAEMLCSMAGYTDTLAAAALGQAESGALSKLARTLGWSR